MSEEEGNTEAPEAEAPTEEAAAPDSPVDEGFQRPSADRFEQQAPADPAPADAASGDPAPAAGDAQCSIHEHVRAVGTCEHCGSFACQDCLGELGQRLVCRTCVVEGRVQVGLTPWDERDKLGWFAAWWETLKQVTLKPSEFFSNLGPSHFMGAAIGFALLAGTPGQIANVLLTNIGNVLLFEVMGMDMGQAYGNDALSEMFRPGGALQIVIGVVMAPLGVLMNAMLYGLLGHLGLMIVGGATKKIEASLKVACYAAAINFWMVIPLPYLNQMVIGIWWMVVLAIGLMKMHNTTGLKAAFAVLWFPCLCGCLIGGGAALVGVAATTL